MAVEKGWRELRIGIEEMTKLKIQIIWIKAQPNNRVIQSGRIVDLTQKHMAPWQDVGGCRPGLLPCLS